MGRGAAIDLTAGPQGEATISAIGVLAGSDAAKGGMRKTKVKPAAGDRSSRTTAERSVTSQSRKTRETIAASGGGEQQRGCVKQEVCGESGRGDQKICALVTEIVRQKNQVKRVGGGQRET